MKAIKIIALSISLLFVVFSANASELHDAVKTGKITEVSKLLELAKPSDIMHEAYRRSDQRLRVLKKQSLLAKVISAHLEKKIELLGERIGSGVLSTDKDGNPIPVYKEFDELRELQKQKQIALNKELESLKEEGKAINEEREKIDTLYQDMQKRMAMEAAGIPVPLDKEYIDAREEHGRTPLFLAVSKGYISIAKLLIPRGSSVNVQDNYGNTPLHIAAQNSNFKMCKLLLDNHADVSIKNSKGYTPLYIAKSKKIISLLRKAGDQ